MEPITSNTAYPGGGLSLVRRYQDEHLTVDLRPGGAVYLDAQPMRLTRKEFELLCLLTDNAGEIVPRNVLLMKVWGYSMEIRTRTLDVHIRRLRKKLGSYADSYIETVFGVGYRFQRFRQPHRFAGFLPNLLAATA